MSTVVYDHEPTPQERGDFWIAIHSWIFQADISHNALCAYIGLAKHADRSGHCWPSLAMLAEEMRLSRTSIVRGVKELEEKGLLRRKAHHVNNAQRASHYWLRLTAPQGLSVARDETDNSGQTVYVVDDDAPPTQVDTVVHTEPGVFQVHSTPVLMEATLVPTAPPPVLTEPQNTTREHHQGTTASSSVEEFPSSGAESVGDTSAIEPSERPAQQRPSGRQLTVATKKPTGTKRGTRLPDDWAPSADLLAWAAESTPNIDPMAETEAFRDYWRGVSGSRGTKLDWDATWRNWMRRARPSRPARSTGGEAYFQLAHQMLMEGAR